MMNKNKFNKLAGRMTYLLALAIGTMQGDASCDKPRGEGCCSCLGECPYTPPTDYYGIWGEGGCVMTATYVALGVDPLLPGDLVHGDCELSANEIKGRPMELVQLKMAECPDKASLIVKRLSAHLSRFDDCTHQDLRSSLDVYRLALQFVEGVPVFQVDGPDMERCHDFNHRLFEWLESSTSLCQNPDFINSVISSTSSLCPSLFCPSEVLSISPQCEYAGQLAKFLHLYGGAGVEPSQETYDYVVSVWRPAIREAVDLVQAKVSELDPTSSLLQIVQRKGDLIEMVRVLNRHFRWFNNYDQFNELFNESDSRVNEMRGQIDGFFAAAYPDLSREWIF
jgi:hypothetical protein